MNTYVTIALLCYLFAVIYCPEYGLAHTIYKTRNIRQNAELKLEPIEEVARVGDNVTFKCSFPSNVTFGWDFLSKIKPSKIVNGVEISDAKPVYFSSIHLDSVGRAMSGEIICTAKELDISSVGFLVVKGVRISESCEDVSDCITDRAACVKGVCTCPKKHVLIRLAEKDYEVCREMIYNLYDPCEFNEQCIHLVDEKSICASNSICVCAPWTVDIKGKCISRSEITYNKSQEMYRVGLIAVTCIIILIIALSLWITLNKSCHEQNSNGQQSSISHTNSSFPEALQIDANDKPPAYDDVLITQDVVTSPPNIKEALKNCMTAKKLLRQVSAPAGNLLPTNIEHNTKKKDKNIVEN